MFPAPIGTHSRDTGKGTRYAIRETMNSTTVSRPSAEPFWLMFAHLLQILVICLTVGLFIASIPINYEQRSIVCRVEACPPEQLTPASEQALRQIGMSVDSFVRMTIALDRKSV